MGQLFSRRLPATVRATGTGTRLAAVVVLADTALLVGSHQASLPLWVVSLYALAVTLVVALRYRSPLAAFVAALVLASLTGGAYVLLIWAAYQAGRSAASRPSKVMAVGAAVGGLGVQLANRAADPRAISHLLTTYVVFVALPLLVGRYLAQHDRLVSTLDRHNRQLRQKRELLAEQERLRERLRIARDMHDCLGSRLSLVSIQAAALEVSSLPQQQRHAVLQLAQTARAAMNELHELVGALREGDEPHGRSGLEAIATVVEEFRAAGATVTLRQSGVPCPLSPAAGEAAHRVVEEGLTNAAKHAPGQPVTANVDWESDALLITVVNPMPEARGPCDGRSGHGLSGLGERVRPAGGFLDHGLSDGGFRLFAMLPANPPAPAPATEDDDELAPVGSVRLVTLGLAAAALMFVVLPATMLFGVRW